MIRRPFLLGLALFALSASAQQVKDGFYRVKNYGSNRYAYVYDRSGSIDYSNTSADMGAIVLYRTAEKRITDPASIIYISNKGKSGNYQLYDLEAQGTSVYQIISHYVTVTSGTEANTYWVYEPQYSLYLWDRSSTTSEKSGMTTSPVSGKPNLRNWCIYPVDSNTEEYLGIAPASNLQVGTKYYKPYYLGFAFNFASNGMKAYYVKEVKSDAVIIAECGGTVPAATPVIIECSSAETTNNRITPIYNSPSAISGNKLKGNYFCYGEHAETDRLLYNPSTMRVLAVVNGKLQYITDTNHQYTTPLELKSGTLYHVNANESYLSVPAGTAASLPVMTQEEYDALHPATKRGDINGDGTVDVIDVAYIYRAIAAGTKASAAPQYDIDGNGSIDAIDVAMIYRIIAKES